MSKIQLSHIDKFYGENHVLRDVNLTIEDGDFMTLLGPSGCGKTTTLRVISGLEKAQHGTMTIDDKMVIDADKAFFEAPSKRGLNLVFQSYALWPHMTVFENVAFGLKIKKMKKEEIEETVMRALKTMRIEEYRGRYPNELSGGQQQRVAIARAIAADPPIIMADEPTGALDSKTGRHVLEILRDLYRGGTTVLLITHDENIAANAKRVVRLSDGRIISDQLQEVDWE